MKTKLFTLLAALSIGSASLQAQSIQVIYPNGGESFLAGKNGANPGDPSSFNNYIKWTHTGSIAKVKIEFSNNNGLTWHPYKFHYNVLGETYDNVFPNTDSIPFNIPGYYNNNNCLVKVIDESNNQINDQSDSPFTVSGSLAVSVYRAALDSFDYLNPKPLIFDFTLYTAHDTAILSNNINHVLNWGDGSPYKFTNFSSFNDSNYFLSFSHTYIINGFYSAYTYNGLLSGFGPSFKVVNAPYNKGVLFTLYNNPINYPTNNYGDTICASDTAKFNFFFRSMGFTTSEVTSAIIDFGDGAQETLFFNGDTLIQTTFLKHVYTQSGTYNINVIGYSPSGGYADTHTYTNAITVLGCGDINGTVYKDANTDCSLTTGEQKINAVEIKATNVLTNQVFLAWTNVNGYYSLNVPVGSYSIEIANATLGYNITCTNSLAHVISVTSGTASVNNFGINCGAFDVAVTGIALMNGFFPGQEGALLPHIGILNGNACNYIIPGQIKMVLSNCVTYANNSTNYGWLTPQPSTIIAAPNGDTLVWNVSDVNNMGNFGYFDFPAAITTCTNAQVGDSVCITVIVLPTSGDADMSNNSFTRCFEIGVAYDPNYKEVSPKGTGVQGYIAANSQDDMTYTIHFQNTGTATATNIFVIDTISKNLDLGSLEIVSSSHAMQPYLEDNRVMKFMFANIMLPDSVSDEPHSHGYVTYRIKQKAGLVAGNQIKNTGYIYFDFNTPIVTNTTLNTISGTVTFINEQTKQATLLVYPNPNNGNFTVELTSTEKQSLQLFDVTGNLVLNQVVENGKALIDANHLSAGVYNINIKGTNGVINQKIVIVK